MADLVNKPTHNLKEKLTLIMNVQLDGTSSARQQSDGQCRFPVITAHGVKYSPQRLGFNCQEKAKSDRGAMFYTKSLHQAETRLA